MDKELDFNQDFDFINNTGYTYFNGKKLVLVKYYNYIGPITLQYLPNGGIQSVFNYHLIIKVNNGFIACDELIYDGVKMNSKTFIMKYPNLINQVLPS